MASSKPALQNPVMPVLADVVKYNFAIDTSGLVSVLTDMSTRMISLEKSREEIYGMLKVSQNASEQLRSRVLELEAQLANVPGATERTCSSIVNAALSKLPKYTHQELFEAKSRQIATDFATISEELDRINDKIGSKKDGEKALSDQAEAEVRNIIASETFSCIRTVPDLIRLECALADAEATSKLSAPRSKSIKAIEENVVRIMSDVSKTTAALKSNSDTMAEIQADSARAFEAVALLQEKSVSGPKQMMQKMVDDLDKQMRNFTISSVQDVEANLTSMEEKITELFTTKVNHHQVADSVTTALSKINISGEVNAIRAALNVLSDRVSVIGKQNESSEEEADSLKKLEKSLSKLKQLLDDKVDKTVFEDAKLGSSEKKEEITAYMVSTGLQKCMSCNRPLPSDAVHRGSKITASHANSGSETSVSADAFPHVHFAENVDRLRETALIAPLSRNKFQESHAKSDIIQAKMSLSMAEQGVVPKQFSNNHLTYSIMHGKQTPLPQSPVMTGFGQVTHEAVTPIPLQLDYGIDRSFKGIVPQTASGAYRGKQPTPEPQQSSVPNRFPSLHSPMQGKHVGAGKNIPRNPLKKHAVTNESPY